MSSSSVEDSHQQVSLAYTIVALVIFVVTAYTFLFPLNKLVTLGKGRLHLINIKQLNLHDIS